MDASVRQELTAIVNKMATQFLTSREAALLLSSYRELGYTLSDYPLSSPTVGSWQLCKRGVRVRVDGLSWQYKEDAKHKRSLKESHVKLTVDGVPTLACYYCITESCSIERRIYWFLNASASSESDPVLVHYSHHSASIAPAAASARPRADLAPQTDATVSATLAPLGAPGIVSKSSLAVDSWSPPVVPVAGLGLGLGAAFFPSSPRAYDPRDTDTSEAHSRRCSGGLTKPPPNVVVVSPTVVYIVCGSPSSTDVMLCLDAEPATLDEGCAFSAQWCVPGPAHVSRIVTSVTSRPMSNVVVVTAPSEAQLRSILGGIPPTGSIEASVQLVSSQCSSFGGFGLTHDASTVSSTGSVSISFVQPLQSHAMAPRKRRAVSALPSSFASGSEGDEPGFVGAPVVHSMGPAFEDVFDEADGSFNVSDRRSVASTGAFSSVSAAQRGKPRAHGTLRTGALATSTCTYPSADIRSVYSDGSGTGALSACSHTGRVVRPRRVPRGAEQPLCADDSRAARRGLPRAGVPGSSSILQLVRSRLQAVGDSCPPLANDEVGTYVSSILISACEPPVPRSQRPPRRSHSVGFGASGARSVISAPTGGGDDDLSWRSDDLSPSSSWDRWSSSDELARSSSDDEQGMARAERVPPPPASPSSSALGAEQRSGLREAAALSRSLDSAGDAMPVPDTAVSSLEEASHALLSRVVAQLQALDGPSAEVEAPDDLAADSGAAAARVYDVPGVTHRDPGNATGSSVNRNTRSRVLSAGSLSRQWARYQRKALLALLGLLPAEEARADRRPLTSECEALMHAVRAAEFALTSSSDTPLENTRRRSLQRLRYGLDVIFGFCVGDNAPVVYSRANAAHTWPVAPSSGGLIALPASSNSSAVVQPHLDAAAAAAPPLLLPLPTLAGGRSSIGATPTLHVGPQAPSALLAAAAPAPLSSPSSAAPSAVAASAFVGVGPVMSDADRQVLVDAFSSLSLRDKCAVARALQLNEEKGKVQSLQPPPSSFSELHGTAQIDAEQHNVAVTAVSRSGTPSSSLVLLAQRSEMHVDGVCGSAEDGSSRAEVIGSLGTAAARPSADLSPRVAAARRLVTADTVASASSATPAALVQPALSQLRVPHPESAAAAHAPPAPASPVPPLPIAAADAASALAALSLMSAEERADCEAEAARITSSVRTWLVRKNYRQLRAATRTLQRALRQRRDGAAAGGGRGGGGGGGGPGAPPSRISSRGRGGLAIASPVAPAALLPAQDAGGAASDSSSSMMMVVDFAFSDEGGSASSGMQRPEPITSAASYPSPNRKGAASGFGALTTRETEAAIGSAAPAAASSAEWAVGLREEDEEAAEGGGNLVGAAATAAVAASSESSSSSSSRQRGLTRFRHAVGAAVVIQRCMAKWYSRAPQASSHAAATLPRTPTTGI